MFFTVNKSMNILSSSIEVNVQYLCVSFQGCLTSIYISWMGGNNSLLEKIIGSILGFVHVPPVGAPSVTFSIGIGDKKTLSPPHWEHVPVTGKSVASLFRQLGKFDIQ